MLRWEVQETEKIENRQKKKIPALNIWFGKFLYRRGIR